MNNKNYPLIHPGEILREELLIPYNLTAERLAKELKVEPRVIQDLLSEQGNITADLATRLALYFQIGADF
jgi:antitoxin HigA-1